MVWLGTFGNDVPVWLNRHGSMPTSGSPPGSSSRTSSPGSPAGRRWSPRGWRRWRRCSCCTTRSASATRGRRGGSPTATRSTTTSARSPRPPGSLRARRGAQPRPGDRRGLRRRPARDARGGDRRRARTSRCSRSPALFDVVLTTGSGYPLDQNLYQAVKGMSAADQVVRPGGTIVCAAECRDGFPDHGSYREELTSGLAGAAARRHRQRATRPSPTSGRSRSRRGSSPPGRDAHVLPHRRRTGGGAPGADRGHRRHIEQALRSVGRRRDAVRAPRGPQTIPYVATEPPEHDSGTGPGGLDHRRPVGSGQLSALPSCFAVSGAALVRRSLASSGRELPPPALSEPFM